VNISDMHHFLSGSVLSQHMYDAALAAEHARWEIHSDLGASLHAMRQLGHWHPFTGNYADTCARMIELGVLAHAVMAQAPVQDHQQSRRVGPPTQEHSNAEQTSRHLW
jgi:hypothetical protein